ncbi:HrpE/YscL family type III secretion apparatus protein [Pseudomonas aeruginosa]
MPRKSSARPARGYQGQKRLGAEGRIGGGASRRPRGYQETLLRCNPLLPARSIRQLGEVVLQAVAAGVAPLRPRVELTGGPRAGTGIGEATRAGDPDVQPEQLGSRCASRSPGIAQGFPQVELPGVVGDARLDQGGCIHENRDPGSSSASLDSQLAALQAALTEGVARSRRKRSVGGQAPPPAQALVRARAETAPFRPQRRDAGGAVGAFKRGEAAARFAPNRG